MPVLWLTTLLQLCEAGELPGGTARSGLITWLGDGKTMAVANPDAGTVTLLGTLPLTKLAEIPVGPNPRSVATSADGATLYVALPTMDRMVWVDVARRRKTGELETLGGPFAVVSHPQRNTAYVADFHARTVSEIGGSIRKITRQVGVATAPRGLALSTDGSRLFVVHFYSGALSIVDTDGLTLVAHIANRPDANLARSVAVSPDGQSAFLPHLRANVGNPHLQFDTTVFPVVSKFDLASYSDVREERIALDAIGRPVNNPWDAAVTPDGRRLFVVHAGTDDVQVIDLESGRSLAQIDVGTNPRGIVLSADGARAYVYNALSRDVSVVGGQSLTELYRLRTTDDRQPPDIRRGQVLFHSARLRSLTRDRWVSCASCHPDGGSDGRVWRFPAGPRKTPSLRGAGATLPHNRSPDRDEIQDVELFIRKIMGGRGLLPGRRPPAKLGSPSAGRSRDSDALAAYVRSLRPRLSPFSQKNGERRAAIRRGRAIFFDPATRCSRCHPPPLYTDSSLEHRPWRVHDVGTGDGPEETGGPAFDSPSLLGLYEATSYLHDGRATTLTEVLTRYNPGDRHGVTSHLTEGDVADLVAFLLSLPSEALPAATKGKASTRRGDSLGEH